jgi:hypothetical protein
MITRPNALILDAGGGECHGTSERGSTDGARKSADNGPRKILLPRRPGESKFAPPQAGGSRHRHPPPWQPVAAPRASRGRPRVRRGRLASIGSPPLPLERGYRGLSQPARVGLASADHLQKPEGH